ncbi:MAG: DNA-3-methyladenine glycosylase [Candidatus Firestonebacteria bacterium]
MKVLKRSFFEKQTRVVAKELLGKIFVRKHRGKIFRGRVVETEAYLGLKDPASHACRGITKRNSVMFGPPGVSYIYLCYGFHFMMNVVTEKKGVPGAVLLRGIEPLYGLKGKETNGPGKIAGAFKLKKKDNRLLLSKKNGLFFADDGYRDFKIVKSGRIGIKQGRKLQLRYYIEGNQYVSGNKGAV